jgi:RNA polymerase sigma-70 factor (ECF subfamily)
MDSEPNEQGSDLAALASKIRGLALAIAGEAHMAEDLAQDAWVALLRRRATAPGSFLQASLSRTMRNLMRFRSRSETHRSDREQAVARPEQEACCELALERLEVHQAILQAVHELKEPYRTTVLLRWFEELEPAEIARRMGVPVRTVHTRVSRALAMLRKKLGPRWGSEGSFGLMAALAWLSDMQAPAWKGILAMQTKTKLALAAALFGSAAVAVPVVLFWGSAEVRGERRPTKLVVAKESAATHREDPPTLVPESRQPVDIVNEAKPAELAPASAESGGQPPTSDKGARATTMLEVAAGSFLSASPDLASFEDAVATLAESALVEAGSVHRSVEDGSINGKLTIPGSDLLASFKIMGDRYSISLEPSPDVPLPQPFFARDIRISFLETAGGPEKIENSVQYHPSPKMYPIDSIAPETEVYIGWRFQVGKDGTTAQPTSMKQTPDGTGWIVGDSQTFADIQVSWGSTAPYEVWLQKLSSFKN